MQHRRNQLHSVFFLLQSFLLMSMQQTGECLIDLYEKYLAIGLLLIQSQRFPQQAFEVV